MPTYIPKADSLERRWFVVDASGQVLGKVAVAVADILSGKKKPTYTPFLDTGDHVVVVNAETDPNPSIDKTPAPPSLAVLMNAVSGGQIRRYNLRNGDMVIGHVRPPRESERHYGLLKVESVNSIDAEEAKLREFVVLW